MMSNKMLKRICWNSVIAAIPLFSICYGQSSAQWEKTSFPSSAKVNTIVIRDSEIFAGTNGDGIFLSTDKGDNWNSINEGLQSKIIYKIFINGTDIYAGTETGVSVSKDNGLSWTTNNSALSGKGVFSFAANSAGDTIFAGTSSGVCYSTDNGENWKTSGLSNLTMPVNSIVTYKHIKTSERKNKRYVVASTFAGGMYRSEDNGLNWEDFSIRFIDPQSRINTIVSIFNLATKNGDKSDTIMVGSLTGVIYYTPFTELIAKSQLKFPGIEFYGIYQPILCFANRNSIYFAGDLEGNLFFSDTGLFDWKIFLLSSTKQAIYSLVMDNFYFYAGTANGIWRLWYPETSTNVEVANESPAGFYLEQNYPNPFNSSTKIRFTIPNSSNVSLKVYNVLGELVDNLVDKYMDAGTYDVEFSQTNLESGVYFYSLIAGEFRSTRKLNLLK